MYRILLPLDAGKHGKLSPDHDGGVSSLHWLKPAALARLIACGAISRVVPPPLAVLPGWKLRAPKLAALGIVDVVQLLEANSDKIAQALGYKRSSTIDGWKKAAREYIVTPPTRKARR